MHCHKPDALHHTGPTIRVAISNSPSNSYSVYAFVDTGAKTTAITPLVVKELNLLSEGKAPVDSATEKDKDLDTYDVTVTIIATNKSHRIIASGIPYDRCEPKGFNAVIGRDILKEYTLLYNGATGDVTLFDNPISDDVIIQATPDTTIIQDDRDIPAVGPLR